MRYQRKLDIERWVNRWVQKIDLHRGPTQVVDLATDTVIAEYESVCTLLARAGSKAGDVWLWCLHCCRFFQAKHLKLDLFSNWQQCPFDDCGFAGFDIEILPWNNGAHEEGWPSSTDELWYGREYPPRPESDDRMPN
jgi:hypothetical protein